MALQSSGQITLKNIQGEFGGSAPHTLKEYYGAASGVPSSGEITIKDFYGKSNIFAFTISSNTSNANLSTLATAAGWDGSSNIQATVASGVYLWASTTSNYGLTVNVANAIIINNGKIIGCGGKGGSDTRYGSVDGEDGGAAINITVSGTTITNNSGAYIAGGGGGGGASAHYLASSRAGGGGGAGGGAGGDGVKSNNGFGTVTPTKTDGGPGGAIGNAGSDGTVAGFSGGDNDGKGFGGGSGGGGGNSEAHPSTSYTGSGGGGGGGRILPGTGGAATTGSYTTGAGGSGSSAGGNGHAGGGGGWGAAGGTGGGGSGGSGGAAITGSSRTLTNNGFIYGST